MALCSGLRFQQLRKAEVIAPELGIPHFAVAAEVDAIKAAAEPLDVAVAEAPTVVLEEEVYAAWARENAAQQAESLYRRYPDVKLVWAGNDLMAFGAMAAWEKRGACPGCG